MTIKYSTTKIMLIVILACAPAIAMSSIIFGLGIIKNLIISIVTALLLESLCLKLRNKSLIPTLLDLSAILTAVLFALCLPPDFSSFKIIIGLFFGIVITKHLYGGLGHNIFNPAMIAYVVLLVAFPKDFTIWSIPSEFINNLVTYWSTETIYNFHYFADDISQATPLDPIVINKSNSHYLYSFYLINFSWLLGGIYLAYKKIIQLRLSIGFISGLFSASTLNFFLFDGQLYFPWQHLFLGASMMGAFFIITDPVTASVTKYGQSIYSVLAGVLCFLIREHGGYPDGVAFAVLFMNTWVPLLNRMTK